MLGNTVASSIQRAMGDCQPMTRFQVDSGLEVICGLLLPPRCVLCGGRGQRPCLDLCAGCEVALPASPQVLLEGQRPIERCLAPFAYAFPVDHLIQLLKYRGHLAVGRVLGTLLARSVRALGLHHDVDCVVPVPLHPGRHAERGFNQSAEIAGRVARVLGLETLEGAVGRVRDTRPQVGLPPEERRRNIAGAFVASALISGPAGRRRGRRDDHGSYRRRRRRGAATGRRDLGRRLVRCASHPPGQVRLEAPTMRHFRA